MGCYPDLLVAFESLDGVGELVTIDFVQDRPALDRPADGCGRQMPHSIHGIANGCKPVRQ